MQKRQQTEEQSAELRYRGIIEKGNELNDQAREFADTRNMLNKERRETIDEIKELRDERDHLNNKMRQYKKTRNGYQDKAKDLIEKTVTKT